MNNIYWCFHKDDDFYGLYVIAETRGEAKRIYSDEVSEDYIDIRCHIYKRGVNEWKGIIDVDSKLLSKYGLIYGDEE